MSSSSTPPRQPRRRVSGLRRSPPPPRRDPPGSDPPTPSPGGSSSTRRPNPSKLWTGTMNIQSSTFPIPLTDCLPELLRPLIGDPLKRAVMQLEKAPTTGQLHWQFAVEATRRIRPFSLGLPTHIHWEKSKGTWEQNVAYCSKPQTRVWPTVHLPHQRSLSIIQNLRPWQNLLSNLLKEEPNDRTILWFWEETGNSGKSALTRYLVHHHRACILQGKGVDCLHGVMKYQELNSVFPDIIIYDVPRTNVDFLSYTALESLKNGCFFSGKYEGGQVLMPHPHVVVFANQQPDFAKMSADRWRTYYINTEDHTCALT